MEERAAVCVVAGEGLRPALGLLLIMADGGDREPATGAGDAAVEASAAPGSIKPRSDATCPLPVGDRTASVTEGRDDATPRGIAAGRTKESEVDVDFWSKGAPTVSGLPRGMS